MRKTIISNHQQAPATSSASWLDLAAIARVEVTSEDAARPIEAALVGNNASGWRAATSGVQTIRLLFDAPQTLRRIYLLFSEQNGGERTQEFVLRWSADSQSYREIVRQQYNFAPPDVTTEAEDYNVNLDNVIALELVINPDKNGNTLASLAQLRLA